MSWCDFIRDFQELIGIAVGFLGVIATLFVTAYLARRQHALEAGLVYDQRQHEAIVLSRGLLVELTHARRSIHSIANYQDTQSADKMILPLYRTPIFDANGQNIGRLPGNSAPIVVRAYHQIQTLWDGVRWAAIEEKADNVFTVPISKVPPIQDKARHVVKRLDEAIEALAQEVGDPTQSD